MGKLIGTFNEDMLLEFYVLYSKYPLNIHYNKTQNYNIEQKKLVASLSVIQILLVLQ